MSPTAVGPEKMCAGICSTSPSLTMTARAMTFSSSRTLPGHSYRLEHGKRAPIDARDRPAELGGVLRGEVRREHADVLRPFAERRHAYGKDAQAVEEIRSEPAGGDFVGQIAIGGRNDADVHPDRSAAPEPVELARLQHAQQQHLHFGRELADLVQKQRSAIRLFEPSVTPCVGARKRAALVAEELRRQQRLGNGSAVDLDKRFRPSPRPLVHAAGEQLLAGAGFAGDEHGGIGGGDLLDRFERAPQRQRRPDDVAEERCVAEPRLRRLRILAKPIAEPRRVLICQRAGDRHADGPGGTGKEVRLVLREPARQTTGEDREAGELILDEDRQRRIGAHSAGGEREFVLVPRVLREQVAARDSETGADLPADVVVIGHAPACWQRGADRFQCSAMLIDSLFPGLPGYGRVPAGQQSEPCVRRECDGAQALETDDRREVLGNACQKRLQVAVRRKPFPDRQRHRRPIGRGREP